MIYGVFIGRFQVWTEAHAAVALLGFATCDRMVFVIGSAYGPYDDRNPFTGEERAAMIEADLTARGIARNRYHISLISDMPSNEDWAELVKYRVYAYAPVTAEIVLVGMKKDHTSFYLDMFPEWTSNIGVDPHTTSAGMLSATDVRRIFFGGLIEPGDSFGLSTVCETGMISSAVFSFMQDWRHDNPERYDEYVETMLYYDNYKAAWEGAPFPPAFRTGDVCILTTEDDDETLLGVVLIQRKKTPGRGLYAFAGGFANPDETMTQAALREMTEETGLDRNDHRIAFYPETVRVDNPHRSRRGVITTTVVVVVMRESTYLEYVAAGKMKAQDDAGALIHVPIDHVDYKLHNKMFEDHFTILTTILDQFNTQEKES